MKHIIEFDLSNPETREDEEHYLNQAVNANKIFKFIEDFNTFLRSKYKYADEASTTWDDVWTAWHEKLKEFDIDPIEQETYWNGKRDKAQKSSFRWFKK